MFHHTKNKYFPHKNTYVERKLRQKCVLISQKKSKSSKKRSIEAENKNSLKNTHTNFCKIQGIFISKWRQFRRRSFAKSPLGPSSQRSSCFRGFFFWRAGRSPCCWLWSAVPLATERPPRGPRR